jgi:hypothetical protein
MGEQRIREVTMVALIFLLLGVIILLVAAGRIWIDATPIDSSTIDAAAANSSSEAVTMARLSESNDSAV